MGHINVEQRNSMLDCRIMRSRAGKAPRGSLPQPLLSARPALGSDQVAEGFTPSALSNPSTDRDPAGPPGPAPLRGDKRFLPTPSPSCSSFGVCPGLLPRRWALLCGGGPVSPITPRSAGRRLPAPASSAAVPSRAGPTAAAAGLAPPRQRPTYWCPSPLPSADLAAWRCLSFPRSPTAVTLPRLPRPLLRRRPARSSAGAGQR